MSIIKVMKLYCRVILESIKLWQEQQRSMALMDRAFRKSFRKGPKKGTYIRRYE